MASRDNTLNENDVLCGRGVATNNYIGNKMFRALVTKHQQKYWTANKNGKTFVLNRIVLLIRQKGGRFLRQGGDGLWTEIGDKKATQKTSQAMRRGLDVGSFTAGKSSRTNGELISKDELDEANVTLPSTCVQLQEAQALASMIELHETNMKKLDEQITMFKMKLAHIAGNVTAVGYLI